MWWSFYLCCLCNTLSRILSSFLSTWRHTITKTGKSDVMTTELVHWSTWRHTTIKSDVMIWPPTWFNAMWPRLHWWRPFIMTSCLVFQADMMTLTKFLHHVNINHSEKFVPNLNCLKQDLFCLGLSNCLRCPRLPGCVLGIRGCLGVSSKCPRLPGCVAFSQFPWQPFGISKFRLREVLNRPGNYLCAWFRYNRSRNGRGDSNQTRKTSEAAWVCPFPF